MTCSGLVNFRLFTFDPEACADLRHGDILHGTLRIPTLSRSEYEALDVHEQVAILCGNSTHFLSLPFDAQVLGDVTQECQALSNGETVVYGHIVRVSTDLAIYDLWINPHTGHGIIMEETQLTQS